MICQKCQNDRVVRVNAKCDDRIHINLNGVEHDGYVPSDMNIGGGDYINAAVCLDCGQLQGKWPLPPSVLETIDDQNQED